jgi:hypothetical protein
MDHTRRIEAILAVEGMREEVEKYIIEKGYERGSYAESMELDIEYPGLAMGYGLDMNYVIENLLEEKADLAFFFDPEDRGNGSASIFYFLGKFFQIYTGSHPLVGSIQAVDYPNDDLKSEIEDIFYVLGLGNNHYYFPNNYIATIDGTGHVETEFLLNLCLKHTKIGSVIEVNQEKFKRTEQGFVSQGK